MAERTAEEWRAFWDGRRPLSAEQLDDITFNVITARPPVRAEPMRSVDPTDEDWLAAVRYLDFSGPTCPVCGVHPPAQLTQADYDRLCRVAGISSEGRRCLECLYRDVMSALTKKENV